MTADAQSFCCDCESHGGMDGPTIARSFPLGRPPRYLLRDRDGVYGEKFTKRQSGWHSRSPHRTEVTLAEPVCGAVDRIDSRECLDHVIVMNQTGLHRVLKSYFEYYERPRTHLSLEKDAPIPRTVQPPEFGRVIELSEVGGLHHRYERRAA